MSAMMTFTTWFISQLPIFLLSEPISALTGLFILGFVCDLFWRMTGVGGRNW